ncbi:MAG: exopolyphosphatase [Rhizobiaceae bacterium MnEN-MB40S]|nr:MAG: exopolyphosphatase [Rhizobiaceae bacterium MnEN-MB40S]
MVESEAQGRLPGIAPVSVIDIGSNSVRIVIYEGLNRVPTVLFNEKVLCGLGKGLATSGMLDLEGVKRALAALHRFSMLSRQARATRMHVLATAAAREATNGPDFISQAEKILGQEIDVLSGRKEAHYSAMGVISAFFDPDGIVGDLGGGSLELVDIEDRNIGDGITLPIGGLRLAEAADGSLQEARSIARRNMAMATLLERGRGRTFYAVGGTWRNLAKLHMEMTDYPLHMMQGYNISTEETLQFLDKVDKIDAKDPAMRAISRNRRLLLPYGAAVLREIIDAMKPETICFSAFGVREGYLYSLLDDETQLEDPLLAAANELAILRARSPEHARELAEWTGKAFAAFGIEETIEEARYRRAACLLADISWRAHPDYRGAQSFNLIANGTFTAISHPGRAYIALANFYRFEGLSDNNHDERNLAIAEIATPRFRSFAKLLGGLMRVSYLLSASMPGIVPLIDFEQDGEDGLVFKLPEQVKDFAGERLDGRLQQLARYTGKTLSFKFG